MSKQQRWAMQLDICCQRYAGLGEGGGVDPKKRQKSQILRCFPTLPCVLQSTSIANELDKYQVCENSRAQWPQWEDCESLN